MSPSGASTTTLVALVLSTSRASLESEPISVTRFWFARHFRDDSAFLRRPFGVR